MLSTKAENSDRSAGSAEYPKTAYADIEQRILRFVNRANWVLFAMVSGAGLWLTPFNFAKGMVLGGLIVTVNFHLLQHILKKTLTASAGASGNRMFLKYFGRFIAGAAVIFLLIKYRLADPIGMCIGLSIVVMSIMLASMVECTKLLFKEAD